VLRGKVARLVQDGTFPLQNIGFLEGAHPIAAELQLVQYGTFPLQHVAAQGIRQIKRVLLTPLPLHDIAAANIVWCYGQHEGGRVGGRILRIRRAIVLQ